MLGIWLNTFFQDHVEFSRNSHFHGLISNQLHTDIRAIVSYIHRFSLQVSYETNHPNSFQSIDATGRTLTALVLASERCGRKSGGNFRREGFRMCGWAVSTSHVSGEVQGTPWSKPILKQIYNWVVVWNICIFTPTWGRFPCWLIRGWNHQLDNYTWFRIFTFEIIWTIMIWVELEFVIQEPGQWVKLLFLP